MLSLSYYYYYYYCVIYVCSKCAHDAYVFYDSEEIVKSKENVIKKSFSRKYCIAAQQYYDDNNVRVYVLSCLRCDEASI